MKRLSHYDAAGDVSMVDVSMKQVTKRTALARAFVAMSPEVIKALPNNKKGDPLQIARIAGYLRRQENLRTDPALSSNPALACRTRFRSVRRKV